MHKPDRWGQSFCWECDTREEWRWNYWHDGVAYAWLLKELENLALELGLSVEGWS